MTKEEQPPFLDRGDVCVEAYEPHRFHSCGRPVTKIVSLHLRWIGEKAYIGPYCDECAAEMAERVKTS
jgi:hypothetical protein